MLCLLGIHSKPEWAIKDFDIHGQCKYCRKIIALDDKGSLFE